MGDGDGDGDIDPLVKEGDGLPSDTSNFHRSKKSAAVLKHAILNSYIEPFATKTSTHVPGHRVALIDGYAGPGRYESGDEGSVAMLLRIANKVAHSRRPRRVECHFVEADQATADRLTKVVAEEGADVATTIHRGDISEHLPDLLEAVQDIPLLVYLDPCGLPLPLDQVLRIFDRPFGPLAPATEVLVNLTAGVRRVAALLYDATPDGAGLPQQTSLFLDDDPEGAASLRGLSPEAREKSLTRCDAACGGPWWREAWLTNCPSPSAWASDAQKAAAELAVVQGYAARLSAGARGLPARIIAVRPRAELKPVYYLVFATRHPDGVMAFNDAASSGLEKWREYHAERRAGEDREDGAGTLFTPQYDWRAIWTRDEKRLKYAWVTTLTQRLGAELAKGQPFTITDREQETLGHDDLYGLVRTTHLRAAINQLRADGKTTTQTTGVKNLYTLRLTPA